MAESTVNTELLTNVLSCLRQQLKWERVVIGYIPGVYNGCEEMFEVGPFEV